MACEMEIDSLGSLLNYKFYPAVMLSHARLTYTEVNEMLENKKSAIRKKYSNVRENVDLFVWTLSKLLGFQGKKEVSWILIELKAKFYLMTKEKLKTLLARKRNDAHKLIEECMLMANQAAAKYLQSENEDFLYRVHPKPTPEKVEITRQFLTAIDLRLDGGLEPDTSDFAKLLKKAIGREDENIIKTVVLRTMKQATYTPKNEGHFGLAFEDYAHFTSPIRRYPDLLVHRAIKRALSNKKREQSTKDG